MRDENTPVVDETRTEPPSFLSAIYNDIIILSFALFISFTIALVTQSPIVVRFFFVFAFIYAMVRVFRHMLEQRFGE